MQSLAVHRFFEKFDNDPLGTEGQTLTNEELFKKLTASLEALDSTYQLILTKKGEKKLLELIKDFREKIQKEAAETGDPEEAGDPEAWIAVTDVIRETNAIIAHIHAKVVNTKIAVEKLHPHYLKQFLEFFNLDENAITDLEEQKNTDIESDSAGLQVVYKAMVKGKISLSQFDPSPPAPAEQTHMTKEDRDANHVEGDAVTEAQTTQDGQGYDTNQDIERNQQGKRTHGNTTQLPSHKCHRSDSSASPACSQEAIEEDAYETTPEDLDE